MKKTRSFEKLEFNMDEPFDLDADHLIDRSLSCENK